MKSSRISAALVIGLLGALGVSLSGCGGGDSLGPGGNAVTLVRGFNGLQGSPSNIDIEQIGIQPPTAANLSYGAAPSGGYISIRAGNGLNYGVFLTGTTNNAIATGNFSLSAHNSGDSPNSGTYTLLATGIYNSHSGQSAPAIVRLLDSFPFDFSGNGNGTVAFRVVNMIPDYNGTINLFSNGAALNGTDNAGTSAVGYAAANGFNGTHYNSGIRLTGTPALTITDSSNSVLATVPNFNFAANHAYTIFVIGEITPVNGGQPITAVPVMDY